MIYSLTGVVKKKLDSAIVLDVNGVGYKVNFSQTDLRETNVQDSIIVYIEIAVSSSFDFNMYGFIKENSLTIFKLLTSVSGVGPKNAFSIISFADVTTITEAISNADKTFFKKIPGVGPKLALKIIVELQDKVGKVKELNLTPKTRKQADILDALEGLGYDRDICSEAILGVDPSLDESEIIKLVIKRLS